MHKPFIQNINNEKTAEMFVLYWSSQDASFLFLSVKLALESPAVLIVHSDLSVKYLKSLSPRRKETSVLRIFRMLAYQLGPSSIYTEAIGILVSHLSPVPH